MENKTIVITGASSGIGLGIATSFMEHGHKGTLVLTGRNKEKLEQTAQTLSEQGAHIRTYVCDQSQPEQIESFCEHLEKDKMSTTHLINNAAIYSPRAFKEETQSNWNQQFMTNLFGPIQLTRTLWPTLIANKGSVLNISSTLGLRPIENTGAYSASKAAMNSWTQTLALEGGPLGVRANAICPGLVDTPIHGFHNETTAEDKATKKMLHRLQPMGRMGLPKDIAEMAYFLTSNKANWITGSLISVDGGVSVTTRDPS